MTRLILTKHFPTYTDHILRRQKLFQPTFIIISFFRTCLNILKSVMCPPIFPFLKLYIFLKISGAFKLLKIPSVISVPVTISMLSSMILWRLRLSSCIFRFISSWLRLTTIKSIRRVILDTFFYFKLTESSSLECILRLWFLIQISIVFPSTTPFTLISSYMSDSFISFLSCWGLLTRGSSAPVSFWISVAFFSFWGAWSFLSYIIWQSDKAGIIFL